MLNIPAGKEHARDREHERLMTIKGRRGGAFELEAAAKGSARAPQQSYIDVFAERQVPDKGDFVA